MILSLEELKKMDLKMLSRVVLRICLARTIMTLEILEHRIDILYKVLR